MFEIRRGDLFDYSLLLHLPVAVQNQTIAFYDALDNTFFEHPLYFAQLMAQHGAWIIPDNLRFQRRLLRWFSTLHWGIAELLPVALAWQEAEPDNATPGYYYLAQRVFAVKAIACCQNFTRSGGRILLPSLTICCCAGAVSIDRTFSRCW